MLTSYPTWWSELIQGHTKDIKASKVRADAPISVMSTCSGMCPEIVVLEVTCLISVKSDVRRPMFSVICVVCHGIFMGISLRTKG